MQQRSGRRCFADIHHSDGSNLDPISLAKALTRFALSEVDIFVFSSWKSMDTVGSMVSSDQMVRNERIKASNISELFYINATFLFFLKFSFTFSLIPQVRCAQLPVKLPFKVLINVSTPDCPDIN